MAKQKPKKVEAKTEAEKLAEMILDRRIKEVLAHESNIARAAIYLRMREEDLRKYLAR